MALKIDERNTKDDRVLVLSPVEGKDPLSSTGLVDKRLFTGENELHAVKDPQTCFWSLRYTAGVVPPVLKQSFTSFNKLKEFVEQYYNKRNIEIKKIID